MSSIGENALPSAHPTTNSTILMKGAAAASSDLVQQQQARLQQQQARQVLGNVGNAGATLALINQKKEQHFLNQELRKTTTLDQIESKANVAPISSDFGFSIYTDENSNSGGAVKEDAPGKTRFSGSATEDSENLPPSSKLSAPLPSVQHGEHANHFGGLLSIPTAVVVPIQGQCQLDDKSRTPFSEIIVDTPADIKSAPATHAPTTFREHMYELPDYQPDILEYLKEAEVRFRPKPDYMRKQPDINGNMRTVLVDWIVEVCEEYRLNTETLYLAVSYVDRFLSMMSVVRSKLQLVGTSAMFIAAKLEEIYPPDVADFVYITDDTYTKKQVLRMEQLILRALSFDMSAPTPHVFVNLFAVMEDLSDSVRHLAMYLCELSLLYSTPFLQYLPSRVAAAAIAYARLLLNYDGGMWTRAMEMMTGYELGHLQQVICELGAVHEKCPQMVQKAIPEKYRAQKYNEVANIEAMELTEEMFARTYKAISRELEEALMVMAV